MPIVRDGEKFACKQCIQGHRVSGCNHIDRPLQHVNKKGRPVSQCPHCRGLRRSRQTHIKCDCGERRLSHSHSRTTSSESASLAEEEGSCKCKCFLGKKCTCALKKEIPESETASSHSATSPQSQRASPMRWMPPRRSESSIPTFQATYQAQNFGTNQSLPDFGIQLESQHPFQLGRNQHNAQRSVDSLPLTQSSPAQYQLPRMRNPSYDHQFLNPDYAMQQLQSSQAPDVSFVGQIGNEFPIRLDQTTIDRALSPHNTKRYSMNDFSMLAGMSQHITDQHLFPLSAGSEPQQLAFQDYSSHDFAFQGCGPNAAQHQHSQSVAGTDVTFPALSRSSSGTTSDQGEGVFVNPMAQSPQPVITIDPGWGFQNFEGADKGGGFDFTPSTYHETSSEHAPSPFEEPALPVYEIDNGNNGVNPFSTEPPSRGMHNFTLPSNDYSNQGEPRTDFMNRNLPDRSSQSLSPTPQSTLDMDFRFPSHDLTLIDSYSGSPLRQGWSPMTESTGLSPGAQSAH